jgi:hypothetical protein
MWPLELWLHTSSSRLSRGTPLAQVHVADGGVHGFVHGAAASGWVLQEGHDR